MADATVERVSGMELFAEESDTPFDLASAGVKPFSEVIRARLFSVGFLFRMDAYALHSQLFFL